MKISAIITVYNRPEMALACLGALALNTKLVDEAIVSDDGSDERCVQVMRNSFAELPFPVRFVRQEHDGYRLAAARNNAIRAAGGDYILSLDCDILLMPDAVHIHLWHARRGLFLAGNRAMLDAESTADVLKRKISARLLDALWERAGKKQLLKAHRQFQRNQWLRRFKLAAPHKPKILGCHFSAFREDIARVNGFDEKFRGWGFEDDDFTRRLYMAGVRGRSVIHEARAVHLWHPPVASKPEVFSGSPNAAYFRRKDVLAYCLEGLEKKRS